MEQTKWILSRENDIVGTFNKRYEAVEHLIALLKQTLGDLKGQDKIKSGFDYNICYPKIQIYKIKIRPAHLGL